MVVVRLERCWKGSPFFVHQVHGMTCLTLPHTLILCFQPTAFIYAFIDDSGYAATTKFFVSLALLSTSSKNEDFLLTSSRVHDFMQRHHFVTIRSRIFKARHEKSSSWTGGWIVTPGSSPFTLFGVDRDHGIWIWSRRLGWWISHDDQWRWALNVKSIWNSNATSVEGELPPLTKSLFGRTKWW